MEMQNPRGKIFLGNKMKDFQWKHLPKKQMRGRKGISIEESTSLDTLQRSNSRKRAVDTQSVFNFALPREFLKQGT